MLAKNYVHPKTLVRYGLLAWTWFSANSENCRGSQWAVRVGQRLPSGFGQSGAARELGLVQIVVKASAIRGGFPKHLADSSCFWLALSQRFGGLWKGAGHPNGGL